MRLPSRIQQFFLVMVTSAAWWASLSAEPRSAPPPNEEHGLLADTFASAATADFARVEPGSEPPLAGTPPSSLYIHDEDSVSPPIPIPSLTLDVLPAGVVDPQESQGWKPFRTLQNDAEGWWGAWSLQVVLKDVGAEWEEPVPRTAWRTDELMRLELPGPLFAFTQLGASCDSMTAHQLTVVGRTGLGWKLSPWTGSELLLRSGPVVTCTDPLRPDRIQEHSELQVEVQYHCPLPGPLRLEYQGSATPALTATERARINQDLGFAVPLGAAGQLRLGTRYNWQNLPAPLPWTAGMELYVGLSLGR